MFKKLKALIQNSKNKLNYKVTLHVSELRQLDNGEYLAIIQAVNSKLVFEAKPEEILSNDHLVDKFSPKDIRALTYLGYLGINSPQYQILAKRLSEQDDRTIFAIKKRGDNTLITKTAAEIANDKSITEQLCPQDAQIIGYTAASETILAEEKQKQKLRQLAKEQKSIAETDGAS